MGRLDGRRPGDGVSPGREHAGSPERGKAVKIEILGPKPGSKAAAIPQVAFQLSGERAARRLGALGRRDGGRDQGRGPDAGQGDDLRRARQGARRRASTSSSPTGGRPATGLRSRGSSTSEFGMRGLKYRPGACCMRRAAGASAPTPPTARGGCRSTRCGPLRLGLSGLQGGHGMRRYAPDDRLAALAYSMNG